MTSISPDPTIDRQGSPNLIGPKLDIPLLGQKPIQNKPAGFVATVVFANVGSEADLRLIFEV